MPDLPFLNRMAVGFTLCLAVMGILRLTKPLAQPIVVAAETTIALESSKTAKIAGRIAVGLTLALYVGFSPLGVAR